MKKNKAAGARSNDLRKKLRCPFTRSASRIIVVFLILLSFVTIFFVYSRLEKELILRAMEINRNAAAASAARIESAFMAARADALTLIELNKTARKTNDFFRLHPEFAALISTSGTRFVNDVFFAEQGLNEYALDNYLTAESELLKYAAVMEDSMIMLLGNAAPYLNVPLIALFFKDISSGGSANDVIAVFFSASVFTPLLENNAEKTFIVNARDDLLLHCGGVFMAVDNYWQEPLVSLTRQSSAAEMGTVFTGDDGKLYTGAFQKLRIAGAVVLSETSKAAALGGLPETMREIIKFCAALLAIAILFYIALSFFMDIQAGGILREQEEKIIERQRVMNIFRGLPVNRLADIGGLEKIPRYGENKYVTIIFAGVRGFRSFVKHLSPRRTLDALNGMLTLMIDSFAKTGGAADKIAGDTVTEVWGAPFSEDSPEMDALNAVRGALILRAAMIDRGGTDDLDYSMKSRQPRRPTICCGINSGAMLAGQTGPENRCEYTFTGDLVKRARLLEALNKRFGTDILISEYTLALVDKYFITEELPPVKIRGTRKALRVFAVINVKVTKSGVKQPKPTNLAELRQMLAT
jgi:adenylate cyclase